ncbi:MAG: TolC family protein [Acidobacteriota bacterium]|nr:TolC family protein [Acidobacteriota bacterium]
METKVTMLSRKVESRSTYFRWTLPWIRFGVWLLVGFGLTQPLVLSASSPARPTDPQRPDDQAQGQALDELLADAARFNPRLRAAYDRWQAALERIEQADVLPDPQAHFAYFIESVETRVGPQEQKLGVTQKVPWPSKLGLRLEVAVEAARVAEQRYQVIKLRLFYDIKDAYYELYYLARAISITEDNIALLGHLESVAQANFMVGAPVSGVVKAQLELGKLDDRLRTLQDLREPALARLNAALGRPADAPVRWPERVPDRELELEDQLVFESLTERNPELLALDHEIERTSKAIALARTAFRPDFNFGLDWVSTGDAINPALPGSGQDPLVARVSVTLPIWRSKYRSAVREAERRRGAARGARADAEFGLEARVELALFRFHDAERKIDLYRDTLVPLSEASLEVAQQAYEAGKEDFLDVIDAQRQLLELQLALERSLAFREQRLAEVEMLAGRPLAGGASQGDPP